MWTRRSGSRATSGRRRTAPFSPNTVINDARQRWLFRMLHSNRPLQEKMTLFWHNYFATGYTKLAGAIQAANATRALAAKPSEDPAGQKGQIELFRERALGAFSDMLVAVAQDPAMLVWLDGNTNTKAKPQENFGRELMELFTRGVGFYTEDDVYAAARVFTGWNLQGDTRSTTGAFSFVYNANAPRDDREDVQLPDLRRRRPHDSVAVGVGRDAGRHRSDRRAGRASGNRAPPGDEALRVLRQRDGRPAVRTSSTGWPRCTCRTARASAPSSSICSRRRSSRRRRRTSRATRGPSSTS